MGALSVATGCEGVDDYRLAYFRALNAIQKREIPLRDHSPHPHLVFEFDAADRHIVEHFLEVASLDESNLFSSPSAERVRNRMKTGWEGLSDYDPDAVWLAESLVARFLIARKADFGGSSTGDMLGCVWLNPPPAWDAHDYAEAILHESIHQALFLDEMIRRVYAADQQTLADEDARVLSAIRRESRPLDASFHAACVAAALLDFHEALGRADRVNTLRAGLASSLEALTAKSAYLTDHGRQILDELDACLVGA